VSETAAPVAPTANGAVPRNTSGQFSPKAGATGVAPQEGAAPTQGGQENAPPSGPQTPEEWSFEGEYDGPDGQKRKVAYRSKAEAIRAAQELDYLRKRNRAVAEREKQFAEFDRLPPEKRAELLGVQLEEIARRKVLEAAKQLDEQEQLQNLPPDVRARLERARANEERLQSLEAERQAREQTEKERADNQRTAAARQRAVAGLEKGLELTGLPKTHHVMALLAEIQQEATSQGLPPLPPDLLAAEANKRYSERGVEPLKKLQGKALLDRLGGDVVRAVLLAERERRGAAAGQPRQQSVAPPRDERLPSPESEKVYGEGQAEQMLRELRNRR
jgi:hypothetical protein